MSNADVEEREEETELTEFTKWERRVGSAFRY
jgi:hypothetical protein